ncbi:leucine-rich repeat-containing protein 3C isoform X1 [Oreochromis niloticus]|uniref:leucine-rich repeat-containing protein 3C isoform X1 n=1 Tax=Oreochromis niloticus TaxID=8128 RepID=UPI000DF4451D|nr:leucine-rich repeat-containing protein 3C isoform X1 [Oreochromis niloticus]XP_025762290.1 leucine-rich repeat-containing protein 3C isoform X1 [Oreochromis niloticus]XP_025762291.1 leucine-rich repeat-containing protein 3C isoform X1 [Oreochromis niloticus]XP_025762292.1 leucine-rich repeat-containing protein 3C isoform X1 [Oreochromis niloticus]XP_025762293.1 leucine-rich repeat-containing protein 3C isoform X1 [Oreochromis niloticus]XP_025762294.1 leucine-rich repeat-containing protein 3
MSSTAVDVSLQTMPRLFLLLLVLLSLRPVSATSPLTVALGRRGNRISTISACHQLETADGGLTVRCTGLRLTQVCLSAQVPIGLSNHTTRLFLNKNLLTSLAADTFSSLFLLDELDLSHNQLSSLEDGCFRGLDSLSFLDLSHNRLSTLELPVLGGLQIEANLTHNPWHCDCRMELSMPQLDLDPTSLAEVVCATSDLPNLGAVGIPLVVLMEDWDLCLSVRRTTDVVTLVTMFLWLFMLICYLAYYIRQNQAVTRRNLEYLKLLESKNPK